MTIIQLMGIASFLAIVYYAMQSGRILSFIPAPSCAVCFFFWTAVCFFIGASLANGHLYVLEAFVVAVFSVICYKFLDS